METHMKWQSPSTIPKDEEVLIAYKKYMLGWNMEEEESDDVKISVAYYVKSNYGYEGFYIYDCDDSYYHMYVEEEHIIAWMPLPKPPELMV